MASPVAVLSILVTANTGGAAASLTRLDRQLKGTAATANTSSARITKAAKVAGLGVAAGLGGSVFAAAKFESAFAEVRKTVETNEKGFKRIEGGLRSLSERIPVSANELANLAGEAGALGVKAKDILKFTKTASQLGTTTDMSAEDASNALARLSNIMDTKGKKSFQRFGSTLVDLGNKGASTEGEISDMALRIAGAGETLGLTESQVLGLSSALANVGIRAEMGGSAISRVMLQMQEAIAKGGGELKNFAEITGVSVGRFVHAFEQNAPRAIAMFAAGLGKVHKAGAPIISTLKGVELSEIRVRDTLLRIAGNTRQFVEAQGIANKAWRQNNALTDEARERYKTLESQLSMLKNSIVDTAIGIGQELMPDVKAMVAILRDPKLTLGDKIAAIGQRLGDMISEWGPKIAEAGARLGLELAKGVGRAFLDSSILGKLFIGGALIRLFGGRGALISAGTKIGGLLGIGVGAGVAGGAGAGAAGGAVAGAAGGSIAGKLGGVLKNVKWARLGGVAGGVAIAGSLLKGFETEAKLQSSDVMERVAGHLETIPSAPKGIPGGPGGSLLEKLLPDTDSDALRDRLQGITETVQRLADAGLQIRPEKFREFTRTINKAAIDEEFKDDLHEMLTLVGGPMAARVDRDAKHIRNSFKQGFNLKETRNQFVSELRVIRANYGRHSAETVKLTAVAKQGVSRQIAAMVKDERISLQQAGRFLDRFGLDIGDLGPEFRVMSGKARTAFLDVGRNTRDMSNQASANFGEMSDAARDAFHKTVRTGRDKSKELKKAVVGTVNSMVGAVGAGYGRMEGDTNKALGALGAKKVNFGISGKAPGEGANVPAGAQRGAIVGGSAPGDRHTLSLDGVPIAKVESGEKIAVVNREAAKREMALNAAVPRFAKGGAMGDIGGLQSGILRLAAIMGNKFGMTVGSGLRPGDDGHHGSGLAADFSGGDFAGASRYMNQIGPQLLEGIFQPGMFPGVPVSWESGQQVPHSFWGSEWANHLDHIHAAISGAGKLAGAVAAEIGRVLLRGPAGPLLDMGQSALDKARKAANEFIASKMPRVSHGNLGTTGVPSGPGKILGASVYGFGEPGTGTVGASNVSLPGKMAFAELGMGHALGHLPFGHKLRLSVGNRSVMAQKLDIGLGGGDVQGHPRVIDLWRDTAEALGLPGTWTGLVKAQGLMAGGIVQSLREGGILNLDRIYKQLHAAGGPGERREILGQARDRINKRTAIDALSADGSLGGVLKELDDKAAEYAESAAFAASLGLTDDDGNLIPGSDVFDGLTQAEWIAGRGDIPGQLGALFGLRNELILKEGNVGAKLRAIGKMVKEIKGPKGLLSEITDRIREIKKRLRQLEKDRRQLEQDLEDATTNKEKSEKAIQAKLDKELEKPPKKRDEERIKLWREQLRSKSTEKAAIQDALALNRDQTRRQNEALARQTELRDAFKPGGPILGTLTTREGDLTTGQEAMLERLRGVQGSGVDMTWLPALPDIGVLKGEIGDAQVTLRELGARQPTISATAGVSEELLETERQLRIEAQQALAVQTAQFDILRSTPVTGAFARGGWAHGLALVGEEGRELIDFGSGARVRSNPETEQLLAGGDVTVVVNGDIVNVPRGKAPIEVRRGDRDIDATLRHTGRRAGRGLAQAGRPAG